MAKVNQHSTNFLINLLPQIENEIVEAKKNNNSVELNELIEEKRIIENELVHRGVINDKF